MNFNHPKQFINAICRIKCEEDHGTGFFISSKNILTANHTVINFEEDETEIKIILADNSHYTATLIAHDEYLDIALLQITGEHENEAYLPIVLDSVRYNEEWSTFGYPFSKLATGQLFHGTVQAHVQNFPYDLHLSSVEIDVNTDYSGISGSPLLINGKVNGIITWSTFRGLGAVSISKIREFLDGENILYENLLDNSWSKEFNSELERIVENHSVVSNLKDSLEEKGNYILLYGSPGSGKSVIASLIEPRSESKTILGRYLLRIPGDDVPIFVKASKDYFIQWLEDILSKYLTGEPIPKSDIKWENRLSRFMMMLDQANALLISKDETAVIIIDGLDEVLSIEREGLNAFLSMFPESLPSNISVLISCSTEEILPVFIRSQLIDGHKIPVTPLDITLTEKFLRNENDRLSLGLNASQFAALSCKSEGHPLYLHYIIETFKIITVAERDEWIDRLPTISGDIRKYYESIWLKHLGLNSDNYWISLIGSQLRESVEPQEFKKMLPENARNNFQTQFPHIKHLFKIGRQISIYHQSFENFVAEKGISDIKNAHVYISDFITHSENSKYGLKNVLYHLLLSEDPLPAVTKCDQKWADDCALIHMEPDLIIGDVELVEELCIDQNMITELLRIKLLLQRLRFRYNTMLSRNVYELADALINMGDSQAALKYIIRQDLLLISITDSLYFLQKLHDVGAEDEAFKLERAVNLQIKRLLEKNRGRGLDVDLFYKNLKLNSVSITTKNYRAKITKHINGITILKNISEDENLEADVRQNVKFLREDIAAYNLAYCVYRMSYYAGLESMAKFSDDIFKRGTAHLLANAALFYQDFAEKSARTVQENDAYKQLLLDIELLVNDYGFDDDEIECLLFVLIKESRQPELLEEMISKQLSNLVGFNLRLPNGVDPDLDSINLFYQQEIYKGYVDKSDVFPVVNNYGEQTWENYLMSMHELCGFLQGKVYRMNAEKKYEQLPVLQKKAQEIIEALNFKLKDRVNFNRCYHLIEDTVPLLYHRLLMIFLDFNDEMISWFVEKIINPENEQLGMYSEGYRRSLFELSKELTKLDTQKQNAFKVVKSLEDHVYHAVQNRWERIPELIEIVGFYAKIGAKSKGRSVYQQMLDTSMGPTWYKESQFGLINCVLREMDHHKADVYYSDFAAQLQYASGEMTFQRYVQSAMSGFIGTMAKAGHISRGIEYLKFQVLPPAEIILENAESSTVDAPIRGDGFILGARAVIEADAMARFLLAVNGDPLLIFALSEIFILNDDTHRYIDYYTKVQYHAYMLAVKNSGFCSVEILDRIVKLIAHDRFSNEKELYIRSLYRNFKTDLDKLHSKLISSGFDSKGLPDVDKKPKKPKIFTKEEDQTFARLGGPFLGAGKMSNYSQLEVAISEAKEEFAMENVMEGLQKLADCLKTLADDGTDVWLGSNLTGDLGDLFDLFKTYASAEQTVCLLKPFITNHLTDDWDVVSYLLGLLNDKVDDAEKDTIIIHVKEHIEFMIRSQGIFKGKYEWLSLPEDTGDDVDKLLLEFLIWWLNHPFKTIRKNAIEAIKWLCEKKTSFVIPALVKVSLAQNFTLSSEHAGYLLKEISPLFSKEIWNVIEVDPDVQTTIMGLDHTMLQIYWRKILKNCSTEDDAANALFNSFNKLFPVENFDGSDIYLEELLEEHVVNTLENLNELNILNGAFMKDFNLQRKLLTDDLGEFEHQRVEVYIRRSFLGEEIDMGHLQYKLHTAINKALSGRVSIGQIKDVTEILQLSL